MMTGVKQHLTSTQLFSISTVNPWKGVIAKILVIQEYGVSIRMLKAKGLIFFGQTIADTLKELVPYACALIANGGMGGIEMTDQ